MQTYTLYIKTHKITGLKYLGQTSYDPYRYSGSGKDWVPHLSQHGYNVETEILYSGTDRKIMSQLGRYYSTLLNVVNASDDFGNKIYANRIPETGGGVAAKNNRFKKQNDGSSVSLDRVRAGTHHLLRRADGTSHATDAVKNGTHNFLGGTIQRKVNKRMLDDGTHPAKQLWTCVHCNVSGFGKSNYARYHGDNCITLTNKKRILPRKKQMERLECPHCKLEMASNNYYRYHGDKCKRKK